MRRRLEVVSACATEGYNLAIELAHPRRVAERLGYFDRSVRMFAFEGAAMGFVVVDFLSCGRKNLFLNFVEHFATPYRLAAYSGGGVTSAVLGGSTMKKLMNRLDPLDRGIIDDGRGFCYGYIKPKRTLREHRVPKGMTASQLRNFDVGVGRSIWFVSCGDPAHILSTIEKFPIERQSDLWAGIGFACTAVGGLSVGQLQELTGCAGVCFEPHIAQGVAIAAYLVGCSDQKNLLHVADACTYICGATAEQVCGYAKALRTEVMAVDESSSDPFSLWAMWRQRLTEYFLCHRSC